jgi:hypothetical protein
MLLETYEGGIEVAMGRVPRYLLPNGLMNLSRWRRRCLWQEEEKSANLLISDLQSYRRVPLVPNPGNR